MADIQANPLSPRAWRREQRLSLAQLAAQIGMRSDGARVVYRRYEIGQHSVPLEIIAKVEQMSEGRVTYMSWLAVRQAWLDIHPAKRERIAA